MKEIKEILLDLYEAEDGIPTIDDIACGHCPKRNICNDDCSQTDEDIIDIYLEVLRAK